MVENREEYIGLYRTSYLIKAFDELVIQAIQQGGVRLIHYSPRGHEVAAAAMMRCLSAEDYLVTTYRGLHDQIAKGMPLELIAREYFGKVGGSCGGKGGPMHLTHPESGVMVTTGVVGSGLPIGVGLSLAASMADDKRVALVSFGDGATNIGAFHEALNLAAVWSLPVIFLCQNNGYGEHTPQAMSTAASSIAARARAYGIHTLEVDGCWAPAMLEVSREAARLAKQRRPVFVEAKVFRFNGHFVGDGDGYMPGGKIELAALSDPIPRLRSLLIEALGVQHSDITELEAACLKEAKAAINAAMEAEPVSGESVLSEVYAE